MSLVRILKSIVASIAGAGLAVLWIVLKSIVASIAAAGLVVLCIVSLWHFALPQLSRSVTTGNFAVTATQRGEERWLTVSTGNGQTAEAKLMSDWGPDLRTNLYKVNQHTIAIIDFGTILAFHDNLPLHGMPTRPARRWAYLGTFLREGDQLGFFPAGTLPECMDILTDDPPPDDERKDIYRRWC